MLYIRPGKWYNRDMKVDMINPELFTWCNYESDFGHRMGLDFADTLDGRKMKREIVRRLVGYCDGSRLSVRPRTDSYAIMLEDDEGERFWFHYPKNYCDEIIGRQ